MSIWLHSSILAVAGVATVAVGIASAAVYSDLGGAAKKADRLHIEQQADDIRYVTVEHRQEGVSVLTRVPVASAE
ncbi:hypothetical protein [Prosthecomicrobium pneumaticum]|uniref:Uncharacterized protein n=1 Tax=Prosthecomicrobium pneumaticum TaxID=81895 RepID=A0A7W9CT08_9HYPH|nr:hypothetical protein [Prosthecomicrobium pneumaticum]MBB5751355.1 hypothetical protein [Prosthecomicrobium pneumaticum]